MDKVNNLYQRLIEARKLLQTLNIKPTGKNQGRFTYYELEDFLPHVTNICSQMGMLPVMNYYADRAVLTIYDTQSEQKLTLESPMSTASLAGCHPVQNLGAAQTYLKRYLYMHAFDIAESDILDGTVNTDEKPRKSQQSQKLAPVQKEEPRPQQKKPADIAEYLVQKGFDAKQAAKCGTIWDEAKTVLGKDTITALQRDFRIITTPEELEDWCRAVFWKVDAANKIQDAQIEGNNEPEFEDDSPSLYDNQEEK